MKKIKKLLSIFTALCLMVTMIPVFMLGTTAAPSANAVMYVATGGKGTGAAPDAPIGDISSAINNIVASGGGTVVLIGPVELTSNIVLGKATGTTVKITSVYDGVDYRDPENGNAALVFTKNWINVSSLCAFEYENITFRMNGQYCSFYANGYPITMGKGVKTEFAEGFDSTKDRAYPNVYGGSAQDLSATKNYPADTSVTIVEGQFWHIYGGGKGTADKPRPSKSATVAIGKDVVVKGAHGFAADDHTAIEGEKIFISVGGDNAAFSEMISEASRKVTVSGNGYVQGTAPGVYNLWAESGYGAKVADTVLPNGEYKSDDKALSVSFVESDINRQAELDASRPMLPAAFPGEYIKGYDNGDGTMNFRPSGNITIAESATILVRLMTTEEKIKGKYTTDRANAGDWYYDNIAYLDTYECFDTFDNFDPNRQITRGEFVKLITLFRTLTEAIDEIKFTDVDASHKYYDAIRAGTMSRLVNGYDNGDGTFSFKPDAPITRAEVVTVINRVFDMADLAPIKYKDMEPDFTDVDGTHWAAYQIVAAAGGKQKPEEKADITGSGEVEFEVEGKVVYTRDGAPEDGDGSSYEKAAPFKAAAGLLKDGGTMVVCGPLSITGNTRLTNGNTGTVMVTSVYGGVDYRTKNNAAVIFTKNWMNLIMSGDTIFDNIAVISKGMNCSIYCDNHRTEFGKDVVCATEGTGSAPVAIYGGSAYDLSGTKNYIGSTDTSVAHTGDYYGNIIVGGGTWGNITAGGKGSEAKPRESDAAVVNIYGNAKVSFISGGSKTDFAKVGGMRVVILNNCPDAIVSPDNYDYIVVVTGDGEAEAVAVSKESVTVKITAANGSKVEGVNEDGTVVLSGEGSLLVTADANGAKAVKGTKDDVGGLADDNVEYASDEYLSELDSMEKKRKEEIFNTKTTVVPKEGKTAYYVSTSGDDANDGKSPEKPWKTIGKLNGADLEAGDVVYFKRGDEWRDVTLSAKAGVTYSAYGEGEKPVINRSPFDGAKVGKWTPVEGYENVYVYSEIIATDVGTIAFNNRTYTDIYAQKICFDYDSSKRPVSGGQVVEDELKFLVNDLDFWHDLGDGPYMEAVAGRGQVYLRSNSGNPAERFSNIEFNRKGNAIAISGHNVTIDNLTVRHAGSHGVGAGTTAGLKVTNCRFEWIGGSMQNYTDGFTRFGNAVEIYGGCDGYLVDNCYIDQVYDAGVTHQISHTAAGDYIMKNVTYSNNVILNCIYSIEHFNRAREGTTRYLANITYKNNLCRLAGYGFGYTRPNKGAASHIRSGTIVDSANFVVENNIFDRSRDVLFLLQKGGDEQIQWKNNVYIHRLGAKYGSANGGTIAYNAVIQDTVNRNFVHEEIGGKYLFIKQ